MAIMAFCMMMCVQTDSFAQFIGPNDGKIEKSGLKRIKSSERERKRKNKGTVRRKNRLLQKSYYKKKSNQTQYPGNIWLDPKPKDFTAIKQRVEKNPSRAKLRASKTRASYFRASSNRKHNGYGSEVVLRKNPKLNYKYSSKAIISNKGNNRIKPAKVNHRKSSRTMQKHKGNIFLQPEAKKKDFNAIKARVEKNPGRSMARRQNQQKNRTISNAALTQNYRGDINVKARKSKHQTYKYDSRAIQKNSGSLKARSVKSAERMRKFSSASSASFNGDIVLPARNHKRLRHEYNSKVVQNSPGSLKARKVKSSKNQLRFSSAMAAGYPGSIRVPARDHKKLSDAYNSKTIQKHQGDIRKRSKVPGPQYTSNYRGDIKSNDKVGRKQWRKYETKIQTNYSGDLNAKRNRPKTGGDPVLTQNTGGIKVYSQKRQKKYESRDSKITGNFSGNIKAKSKKQRNQELQGKSLNFTGYEGGIAVLRKKKQDRWMMKDAKTTGNYSGNLVGLTPKQRKQALQGKSLNLAEYSGNVKVKNRGKSGTRQPMSNASMAAYQGDIIITARERKKLEYEYMSKAQHNYRGEVKQKSYTKWLDGRKYRSNSMANFTGHIKMTNDKMKNNQFEFKSNEMGAFQGHIKMTRNDVKDKRFEHMSKSAHNYSGNLRIKTTSARARYHRNISDRNSQIIGDYRTKSLWFKDLEQQIASARVQNYQGGPKTSLFTRIWLNLFDKSGKLEKVDNKTREPKYDSREYKIWY